MRFLRDNITFILIGVAIPIIMGFDTQLMALVKELRAKGTVLNDVFNMLMGVAAIVGHGSFILIAAALIFALGKTFKSTRTVFIGKYMLIAYAASGILAQLIKHLVGRARPRLTEDLVFIGPSFVSGFDSFPSGHTTVVFCLAFLFGSIYRRYALCFYIIAILTAIERIYNLSHFPSDVFAGALTGMIAAALIKKKTAFMGGAGH